MTGVACRISSWLIRCETPAALRSRVRDVVGQGWPGWVDCTLGEYSGDSIYWRYSVGNFRHSHEKYARSSPRAAGNDSNHYLDPPDPANFIGDGNILSLGLSAARSPRKPIRRNDDGSINDGHVVIFAKSSVTQNSNPGGHPSHSLSLEGAGPAHAPRLHRSAGEDPFREHL